jgi:hypothetical protein
VFYTVKLTVVVAMIAGGGMCANYPDARPQARSIAGDYLVVATELVAPPSASYSEGCHLILSRHGSRVANTWWSGYDPDYSVCSTLLVADRVRLVYVATDEYEGQDAWDYLRLQTLSTG